MTVSFDHDMIDGAPAARFLQRFKEIIEEGKSLQQIAVLDEHDMVIVVNADPLFAQHGDAPWKHEKANLNLVADFIASIPGE